MTPFVGSKTILGPLPPPPPPAGAPGGRAQRPLACRRLRPGLLRENGLADRLHTALPHHLVKLQPSEASLPGSEGTFISGEIPPRPPRGSPPGRSLPRLFNSQPDSQGRCPHSGRNSRKPSGTHHEVAEGPAPACGEAGGCAPDVGGSAACL